MSFSEFYHKIPKNSLINCRYEHVSITPDPLPTVGPPILPIFASSDPLYRYRPDPLSDFRGTPAVEGGDSPLPRSPMDDSLLLLPLCPPMHMLTRSPGRAYGGGGFWTSQKDLSRGSRLGGGGSEGAATRGSEVSKIFVEKASKIQIFQ